MAVTQETLRLLDELNGTVNALIDDATRDLTAAWAHAWDVLEPGFAAGLGNVLAARTDMVTSRRQLFRDPALQEALGGSVRALDALAALTATKATGAARAAAQEGADGQAAIIASQMPPQRPVAEASLSGFAERALAAILARISQRITALTQPLSRDAEQAMRRELVRGIQLGLNPRDVARRILQAVEGAFNGGLTRALTISRTEIMDAYRAAAAVGQNAQRDVVNGWIWLSELDPRRTCGTCWVMHGTEHPLTEPGPQGHPQCLVAGALIEGPRALASTTRWFSGEVIDIEVDGGSLLTVTPNHPVLTTQGWVAAGELREGHHVVRGSGRQGPALGGHPDDHQVPALIEEVAATLGGTRPVSAVRMPTSPEDFHGDGAGSDVHVVRAHRLLGNNLQAAFNQHPDKAALCRRHADLAAFASRGGLRLPFDGWGDSPRRSMSSGNVASVLLRGALGDHDPVGLGLSPRFDARTAQSTFYDTARYRVRLRQGVDGFASLVALDDLGEREFRAGHDRGAPLAVSERIGLRARSPEPTLDQDALESRLARVVPSGDDLAAFASDVVSNRVLGVRRRKWSGHVYNLQTKTGWYLANGIVVHNCRCSRAPAVLSWRDLGFDIEEPPSLIPDAQARFRSLSRDDQLQIMGPGRLAAWERGDVAWADLARLRDNPGWRPSYVPTPVRDLPRAG